MEFRRLGTLKRTERLLFWHAGQPLCDFLRAARHKSFRTDAGGVRNSLPQAQTLLVRVASRIPIPTLSVSIMGFAGEGYRDITQTRVGVRGGVKGGNILVIESKGYSSRVERFVVGRRR